MQFSIVRAVIGGDLDREYQLQGKDFLLARTEKPEVLDEDLDDE